MLRGITTITLFAKDVATARDWYGELLGIEAYFQRPEEGPRAYIEFRVGDYLHELGILDVSYAPDGWTPGGGTVVYWAVDDLPGTWEKLLAMGATEYEKPIERGPGFTTASVLDPFGNVLGIMYNQHYLDVLESGKR